MSRLTTLVVSFSIFALLFVIGFQSFQLNKIVETKCTNETKVVEVVAPTVVPTVMEVVPATKSGKLK